MFYRMYRAFGEHENVEHLASLQGPGYFPPLSVYTIIHILIHRHSYSLIIHKSPTFIDQSSKRYILVSYTATSS